MKAMKHHPNSAVTTGWLLTADDLKRQPWFKGYESQLDQLMQQMQNNLELAIPSHKPIYPDKRNI